MLIRIVPQAESQGNRLPAKLYVNSQPVAWQDFAAILQLQLIQRPPGWPVYLQGESEMAWGEAVQAIDTIKALKAEVILLKSLLASAKAKPR